MALRNTVKDDHSFSFLSAGTVMKHLARRTCVDSFATEYDAYRLLAECNSLYIES